jgi:hypothetical protein
VAADDKENREPNKTASESARAGSQSIAHDYPVVRRRVLLSV